VDSNFLREDFGFIIKSGKEVQFDLGRMLLGDIGKPHLHSNIQKGECMHFKDPFPGCMMGSDTKRQGRGKIVFNNCVFVLFRANKVGLNPIPNIYMPELS
jgi:hypothetical protein